MDSQRYVNVLKSVLICLLICKASGSYDGTSTAEDVRFHRKTPMSLLRETAAFLSAEPDQQFLQKLRDFQFELLQTNYFEFVEDVLQSGILDNIGARSGMQKTQEARAKTQNSVTKANNVKPYNLAISSTDNSTTVTSSTTAPGTVTSEYLTTTPPPNVTTLPPVPVDPLCVNHTLRFLGALAEKESWALQMVDADGRPGPNLNGYQFFWVGDYEECKNVLAREGNSSASSEEEILFRGRYCTALIPLQPSDMHGLIPSVPPAGVHIGVCVPDSCSGQDVTLLLNEVLAFANSSFHVFQSTCQQATVDYDTKAIVALIICSLFILLMVVGTMVDIVLVQWPKCTEAKELGVDHDHIGDGAISVNVRAKNGEREPLLDERAKSSGSEQSRIGKAGQFLLAFSMFTNGKKILNTNQPPGSISCIHGIRFLSMTWVILGHTYVFSLTTAANYATYLQNTLGLWTFQAILGAPVSVDTFFSLSGLLVAYLVLKEMEKTAGKVHWFRFYFHRFWRLTPPYACVLMMLVCVFRYFGDGPNWPQEGTEMNGCKDTWWTNLLYINNFVKAKQMCFNWSWYLANDMQFYIISPLLFVPMFKWRKVGVVLAFVWLLATVVTAGVLAKVNHFPPSIGVTQGNSTVEESADYFVDFYIKPYCRFGPYVIGMLTGYALYVTKCQVNMSLVVSLSGWAVATAVGLAVVYGLYGPANKHFMTDDVAALYNAMSHSVWGACVCWVIFACATGYGGPVNALLSWNALIPLSRLTYMAYLVHPIVMNLYHLGAPSLFYMSHFHLVILFLGFVVAAFGTAFLLSLAFEAPMMALEKLLLHRPQNH